MSARRHVLTDAERLRSRLAMSTEAVRARLRIARRMRPVIGECYACGGPATAMDHLVPRSRGGTDDPDNRAPICEVDNSSKGARTVDEWLHDGLRGSGASHLRPYRFRPGHDPRRPSAMNRKEAE